MVLLLRSILPLAFILQVLAVRGQPLPEGGRRLGLVLSGGGAKGFAHIGVLKVLEEEGIRPDLITGTSMGSVIGGLYACGYSAAQLEELVLAIHWEDVLTNKIPLDRIAMEEKPYYGRFLVELPFDGLKPRIPSGLIRGQKIDELLRRVTLPQHGTTEFDSLPIPFACMATDVSRGQAILQRQGLLAEALRASMSIPTVFSPPMRDTLLLVDGGTMRNFPVSDAKDMGADLIIGVQVGDGLMPADKLQSGVDVLVQASMFISLLEDPHQQELCDVYLRPDLTGYGTASFTTEAARVLIQRGYDIADQHREQIRALATELPLHRRNMPPPVGVTLPDSIRIDRVTVSTDRPGSATLIDRRMRNPGILAVKDLEERLDLLYGTLNFDLINYRLDPSSGDSVLLIKAIGAPPERLALSLNFDNFNQASVGVLAVSRDRLMPGSRLLAEAYIGKYPQLDISFLKYVGPRRLFANVLGAYYSRTPYYLKDAISGDDVVGTFRLVRYGGYLRTQTTSSDHRASGFDLRWEGARQIPTVGGLVELPVGDVTTYFDLQWVDEFRSDRWDLRAFYQYDDMDRPIYPRKGWKAQAYIGHFWATEETVSFSQEFLESLPPDAASELSGRIRVNEYDMFQRLQVEISAVRPLGERFGVLLGASAAFTSERDLSNGDQLLVGGMKANGRESIAFWGLTEYDQGLGEFAITRAGFQWEPKNDLFLQVMGNGLFTALRPNFETLANGDDTAWGAGATLGLKTAFGVIQAGAAHDFTDQDWLSYFNFGFRL